MRLLCRLLRRLLLLQRLLGLRLLCGQRRAIRHRFLPLRLSALAVVVKHFPIVAEPLLPSIRQRGAAFPLRLLLRLRLLLLLGRFCRTSGTVRRRL